MPVDRGAIDAQLREIGEGERWWERREFRELPHILRADERIRGVTSGKLLGSRGLRLRPSGPWLIVATDQRLICLKQERFARRQVDIPAGEIVRLHESNRLRSFQIAIQSSLRRYRIRIPKEDAFRFTGALAPLVPDAARRAHPGLQALARLPGGAAVAALPGVAGLVSKLTMLSPPDYAARDHVERLEATVERLQHDVERLTQQVAFLEDLLQRRAQEAYLPRSTADS